MILSELVEQSYLAYRGKVSNVPSAGSEKYNRILLIANRKQREWARDGNVDWISRFEIRVLKTLSAGTQQYDLDDDILKPSDYVVLTDASGNKRHVSIIKPSNRARYSEGCYISGADPKQLTFLQDITQDMAGWSLTLPCFTMPDDLASSSDTVLVDNPDWLVYATAAELARNDYAKDDQFSNLNGIANDLYAKMVVDNDTNSFLQPNGVVNNMPQFNDLDYGYSAPWARYN